MLGLRKFTLEARDLNMVLVDSFVIDLVTDPTGLGFKQKLTVQESETLDYVVNQVIEKRSIKLQAHFKEPYSYEQIEQFRVFIERYIDPWKFKTVLRIDDPAGTKYVDIYIESFDESQVKARINTINLTVKPLSPFYEMQNRQIIIASNVSGKGYPFSYPYAYGGGIYNDNRINNTYIKSIPLIVTINGPLSDPTVILRNPGENQPYARVQFTGVNLQEGASITVDAVNQRITYMNPLGDVEDFFNSVDKEHDTFLFAAPGESQVIPNLDPELSKGSVTLTYTQYKV